MELLDSTAIIIIICAIIILSYFFSLFSLKTKIPSVLLLILAGIVARYIVQYLGISYSVQPAVIEFFGTVGLIMIVLEAGLDLRLGRRKIPLIRNAFLSAFIVLLFSSLLVAFILRTWLDEPFLNSIIYALPLSIISSAIVIPSLHHLTAEKKDFLVYEASLSDIFGILLFNFFITEKALSLLSASMFFLNIAIAIIISFAISFLLFFLLTKSKVNVKFFLAFAILILLYVTGKLIHLPSLIIILVFGLLISNWDKIKHNKLTQIFPHNQINNALELLHSITAETSFLIRTFFFILFGYSINLHLLLNIEVILIGSAIVAVLLIVRYLYLRLFVKSNIFPELYYMPRGLITILLFYKIPTDLKLSAFNEGILFFVVLVTGLIMMFGAVFYKKERGIIAPDEIYEQG